MPWVLSGTHDGGLARLDLAQQRQALGERPNAYPKIASEI
jgi:hypothetical protein